MRLVFDTRIRNAFIAAMVAATCSCTTPVHDSAPARAMRADPPPTECKAWVGTDRDAELPGYLVRSTCVPLLVTANRPPPDYAGNDYYVDEFTDAKLKARWAACKQAAGAGDHGSWRRQSIDCDRASGREAVSNRSGDA